MNAVSTAIVPVPYQEMERMAHAIAKSGLYSIKTPDQALALMGIAVAEGRHPAIIARDFDIIQNRAAKKAEAMLRDFIAGGGKVEWHELTDAKADATFSHPQGGEARITWDMPRAIRAGLDKKDNWVKYPRAMLRSRTVSEGCRTVGAYATSGMYTPEERIDIDTEIDVTPKESMTTAVENAATKASATPLTREEKDDHLAGINLAETPEQLRAAFSSAWTHASQAHDEAARKEFKEAYDAKKGPPL